MVDLYLSVSEIDELESVSNYLLSLEKSDGEIERDSMKLPLLSNKLKYISKYLEDDFGFILLRGLDSKKYSLEQVKMIYLLIGSHIGRVLLQNREGDLVHDVINRKITLGNIYRLIGVFI